MRDKRGGAAKNLGTRLRQWRKTLPMKSFELARLIKISQGSLSDIENNKSLPSADTLAKLYQFTDLNIIWLLLDNGPMLRTRSEVSDLGEDALISEAGQDCGEDPKLREVVEKTIRIYRYGNHEKKAHLIGFINGADPGDY
ncbi:MAG: helix-turn-helix domain-containing protein [Nitrospinota bacterium]|nr:helix-turn-helix domain-containing protein [Nitrospinota bacterium]